MRLSDIEQVQHWTEELKKLHAALAVLKDGPTKVELRFYRGDEMPDGVSPAVLDIHDMEFSHIAVLARRRIVTDIEEISAALKDLGAEPDSEWRPNAGDRR